MLLALTPPQYSSPTPTLALPKVQLSRSLVSTVALTPTPRAEFEWGSMHLPMFEGGYFAQGYKSVLGPAGEYCNGGRQEATDTGQVGGQRCTGAGRGVVMYGGGARRHVHVAAGGTRCG